mgnify:CR=1 FL=1
MSKRIAIFPFMLAALIGSGQPARADRVSDDFAQRKMEVGQDRYFEIFNRQLSAAERQALEFLYAYMPQPDLTDYSGSFFLQNVDVALRARQEMPWGKNVPEREFRHFVLPVRVNNEALDSSRTVFYDMLKDRVRGLSMYDAVLEVNHWCHEHVTYRPSDSRTSPPLSTMRTSYGRCGEESTFTVAALRAVGIPARQVYTPRWAHTDDNHAWVEAWVDGKWYFFGACEPEPVLNLGWFNAPASRGMLMHTDVFGRYEGPEEVVGQTPCYTEINVTSHYAPTSTAIVRTVNAAGHPVAATVAFKIYNYGEFYTVATKKSSDAGLARMTTGRGDMLVWATDGKQWGFAKCSVGRDDTVTVHLDKANSYNVTEEWDVHPPVQSGTLPSVTQDQAEKNRKRLAYEDSLRNDYVRRTFLSEEEAARLIQVTPPDWAGLPRMLTEACGNVEVLRNFMEKHTQHERDKAMALISVISEKDRRDITTEVLEDHIKHTPDGTGDFYYRYVLNPRVDNEPLTPYKSYFTQVIPAAEQAHYRQVPEAWAAWCRENITVSDRWNPKHLCQSPRAVWETRQTDAHSRDIFFVAAARAMGIPARIDPVTGRAEYAASEENWQDAGLNTISSTAQTSYGWVKCPFSPVAHIDDPKYYTHFTLSKIVNGSPALLNYDEGDTWSQLFKEGQKVDAGQYMLTTGTRMADGSVLTRVSFFTVTPGDTTKVPLVLRESKDGVQVIGSFNSENIYYDLKEKKVKSLLSTTGRGYYLVAMISPNHEPTNHALRDLAIVADGLKKWDRGIILLFADENEASRFNASEFALPDNVVYGIDQTGAIVREMTSNMKLPDASRPIFLIADTFNRVVFVSQGYTIGLGEQMMKVIHQL